REAEELRPRERGGHDVEPGGRTAPRPARGEGEADGAPELGRAPRVRADGTEGPAEAPDGHERARRGVRSGRPGQEADGVPREDGEGRGPRGAGRGQVVDGGRRRRDVQAP